MPRLPARLALLLVPLLEVCGVRPPALDAVARLHHARAGQVARQAAVELGIGAGLMAAALIDLVVALFLSPAGDTAETLLRVHGAGLLGLVALVWGAARLEAAILRLAEALRVRRAIEVGERASVDAP